MATASHRVASSTGYHISPRGYRDHISRVAAVSQRVATASHRVAAAVHRRAAWRPHPTAWMPHLANLARPNNIPFWTLWTAVRLTPEASSDRSITTSLITTIITTGLLNISTKAGNLRLGVVLPHHGLVCGRRLVPGHPSQHAGSISTTALALRRHARAACSLCY